jgi:excinuclease UvrABC nuclease subunit
MGGRMTTKIRATEKNLSKVPNQSGVYVLYRGSGSKYVGSAGAGRLQDRIDQQLSQKRGITSFQYRATTSEREARRLEKDYRDRLNPKQERV